MDNLEHEFRFNDQTAKMVLGLKQDLSAQFAMGGPVSELSQFLTKEPASVEVFSTEAVYAAKAVHIV